MVNGWKVTAFIFIALFTIETGLIIWATVSVIISLDKDIERENECIFNICIDAEDENYIYYTDTRLCECYNNKLEITKQRYIK